MSIAASAACCAALRSRRLSGGHGTADTASACNSLRASLVTLMIAVVSKDVQASMNVQIHIDVPRIAMGSMAWLSRGCHMLLQARSASKPTRLSSALSSLLHLTPCCLPSCAHCHASACARSLIPNCVGICVGAPTHIPTQAGALSPHLAWSAMSVQPHPSLDRVMRRADA